MPILSGYCRGFSNMYINTKAIVLNTIPYSDSKKVVKFYTREQGLISAMVQMSRRSPRMSLLEPFSVVELTAKKSKSSLFHINDVVPNHIFANIPFDAEKRVAALFMTEVVYRTVREQHEDADLYQFLEYSILSLDALSGKVFEFILVFLLEYGRFLGFYPNIDTFEEHSFFDMQNGVFRTMPPLHHDFMGEAEAFQFRRLLNIRYSTLEQIDYPKATINYFLDAIMRFLELHLSDFKYIKSLDVLRQVV